MQVWSPGRPPRRPRRSTCPGATLRCWF